MKILHTADWHLGASLNNAKRYHEFNAMLDFLLDLIRKEQIPCVIVAGDIFDVPVPPNRAIELYYRFLTGCAVAGVRHCIIIAGNHDSPSFIEAPKELLKRLNVHVFGSFNREDPASHLIDLDGEAVVLALPFLHERDVRSSLSGETYNEQRSALQQGTIETYRALTALAKEKYPALPLIATGHFWAVEKEGEAEPVGNTHPIPLCDFPPEIGYLALGHIHGGYPVIPTGYYSGSPLPMKFDEAEKDKCVLIVETNHLSAPPQIITLPVFQPMKTLCGNMEEIAAQIAELAETGTGIWLRVENTGAFQPNLRTDLLDLIKGTKLELISCGNREPNPAILRRTVATEKLSELTPETVFQRLLAQQEIPEEEQDDLLNAFRLAEETLRITEREEKAE